MAPKYPPVRPNLVTLTNSGMRIAWSGTIIALTMMRNTPVEARNRSFENANPAGRPTHRMMKIEAEQTMVELRASWPIGMTLVRLDQLSQENPPPDRNWFSDCRLVMIMTQNGYSMTTATTIIAPKRIQRPVLRGFFTDTGSMRSSDSVRGVSRVVIRSIR